VFTNSVASRVYEKQIRRGHPEPAKHRAPGRSVNTPAGQHTTVSLIPVCTPTGKIVQHLDSDYAETLKGVRLVRAGRKGRGPVVRVQLLPLTAHCVETFYARRAQFEQRLTNGRVWALRGVEGSK
jgi:hypothetical protein